MKTLHYFLLGGLIAYAFTVYGNAGVQTTPVSAEPVTISQGEVPPPTEISVEDEYPNSRYVRVTVHFATYPDEVFTLPRKGMTSYKYLDEIVDELYNRFKRRGK